MTTIPRDHWRPNCVLWTDASVSRYGNRGGIAVVRNDGVVLHTRTFLADADLRIDDLERLAIEEALRIARRLVTAGGGPVEVRSDSRVALRGLDVRQDDLGNIRLCWRRRSHNIAHDSAQAAVGGVGPPVRMAA